MYFSSLPYQQHNCLAWQMQEYQGIILQLVKLINRRLIPLIFFFFSDGTEIRPLVDFTGAELSEDGTKECAKGAEKGS